MIAQKKDKIEYVDEFRKISTLEKLPTIISSINNIFDEEAVKDSNNKFMRLRKQPVIEHWANPEQQNYILANRLVQKTVNNTLDEEKQQYSGQDVRIRKGIEKFKQNSQENCKTKGIAEKFKFFYKEASPPKKIAEDSIGKEAYKIAGVTADSQSQAEGFGQGVDFLSKNYTKDKYNFDLINKKREEQYLEDEDKKIEVEQEQDLELLLTFKKYQNFRDIKDIIGIDEYEMSQKDFKYSLQGDEEDSKLNQYLLSKFIFKSCKIASQNVGTSVQYFRDIGLPSRDLPAYSFIINSQKENKEIIEEEMKEEAHLLHLLRQKQLNINKFEISFDDLANISMNRVTSFNAYLCVRSEKITKAQFDKLIKKLDKYKQQQREKGKETIQAGVITENIQNLDIEEEIKKKTNKNYNPTWVLANQIMELIQETKTIENRNKKDQLCVQEQTFKKQRHNRIQILLKKLYGRVVINPTKYPLMNIQQLLQNQNLDQILTEDGKNGKMLWFILNCYQDILANTPKQDNIRSILRKKPIEEPKLSFFKGQKLVKEDRIRTINLFTYKQKQNQTKSIKKSPIKPISIGKSQNKEKSLIKTTAKTPNKNRQTTPSKTIKRDQNGETARNSTTPRKNLWKY